MRLTVVECPLGVPANTCACDNEGNLYVLAERGDLAGTWLRKATEAEVALWVTLGWDDNFLWRVPQQQGGGWKKLVDVLGDDVL